MSLTKQDIADIRTVVLEALEAVVEPRFEDLEARFDKLEARFDRLESEFRISKGRDGKLQV